MSKIELETEQKEYNRNLLLEQLENIPANQRYLLTYIKDGRRWYVTLDRQDVIDNIISKIRTLIGDNLTVTSDIFTYGNSAIFTLTESNVSSIVDVYRNDASSGVTHSYNSVSKIPLSGKVRNEVLETIVKFYSLHLPGLKKIKSLEVLKEVFS